MLAVWSFEDGKVNRKDLFDDCVVVLSRLVEVDPDGVSLLDFSEELLLDLFVLLEVTLLPQFLHLVVKLGRLLGTFLDGFGLLFVYDDGVQHEAVEKVGFHVRVVLGLDNLVQLLEDFYLELHERLVCVRQQVENELSHLFPDSLVVKSQFAHDLA